MCNSINCSLSVYAPKCFFPVCLYQLFMKSIKVFSIEKPLFMTRIDGTGRSGERESRDTLVVNYTDGSHVQNQRETPKDMLQKSNASSDLCAPLLLFLWHIDIQVFVMDSKSCHPLCSRRKHGISS